MKHWILVLLLAGWVSPSTAADTQRISNLAVSEKDNQILVSATLEGGFPRAIGDEIRTGVPREFFYYIVLNREIPLWYDEEKVAKTLRFTVKYDLLKKQFQVTRREGGDTVQRYFDSAEEMVRWVSTLSEVPLTSVRSLSGGHPYYIGVKAEMKAGELSGILKYMLFFVPYSRFDTPWARTKVFHAAEIVH